jgi:hypothetical protein
MNEKIDLENLLLTIDEAKFNHIVICGNQCSEILAAEHQVKKKALFVIDARKLVDNYYCQTDKIERGNKKMIDAILTDLNHDISVKDVVEIKVENELTNIIYEDDQAVSAIHGSIHGGEIGILSYLLNMSQCPLGGAKQLLHYFIQQSLKNNVVYLCVINANIPAKILEAIGFERIIVLSLNDE